MLINKVVFPLYKLRSYLSIDENPLGLVKITTIKGEYVIDDKSINAPFHERRLLLFSQFPKDKIYKLKERVAYLRQLVKYKSGTTFIDYNGNIIKYTKSTKLFDIKSHKILNINKYDNWTIFYVRGIEIPFMIGEHLKYNVKYASIMHTNAY